MLVEYNFYGCFFFKYLTDHAEIYSLGSSELLLNSVKIGYIRNNCSITMTIWRMQTWCLLNDPPTFDYLRRQSLLQTNCISKTLINSTLLLVATSKAKTRVEDSHDSKAVWRFLRRLESFLSFWTVSEVRIKLTIDFLPSPLNTGAPLAYKDLFSFSRSIRCECIAHYTIHLNHFKPIWLTSD